jgi:serine/threonine protein kinase
MRTNHEKAQASNYLIFIAESYQECLVWQEALSAYVIHKKPIDSVYEMQKKLGQGSYGNVFLAKPINSS